jgi:hypothetical protein
MSDICGFGLQSLYASYQKVSVNLKGCYNDLLALVFHISLSNLRGKNISLTQYMNISAQSLTYKHVARLTVCFTDISRF